MVFRYIKKDQPISDEAFDTIYPESIQHLASTHFSPIEVAKIAARFLAPDDQAKVLDIGSGAGKFCMIGATMTEGHFTGVEQRVQLHQAAIRLTSKFKISNVHFLQANITSIDFTSFNAFYFYNPFYENIVKMDRMDDIIPLDNRLYHSYSAYVKNELAKMPKGTRLVTYYSEQEEVPKSFTAVRKLPDLKLVLWEKEKG